MATQNLPSGFTTRKATMEDITAVVKLINDYAEHFLGYRGSTINRIETEWKTPRFNYEEDIHLVFNTQGELVGYIEVWMTGDPPVHPWIWGRVQPDYHGQGIGTYLMSWAENHAHQALTRCPGDLGYRCLSPAGHARPDRGDPRC